MASALSNLAETCRVLGRHDEAEPLFRRAIAIREKANGPDGPELAPPLNNLAELCRELARYEEAEPLYLRALSIREHSHGVEPGWR